MYPEIAKIVTLPSILAEGEKMIENMFSTLRTKLASGLDYDLEKDMKITEAKEAVLEYIKTKKNSIICISILDRNSRPALSIVVKNSEKPIEYLTQRIIDIDHTMTKTSFKKVVDDSILQERGFINQIN